MTSYNTLQKEIISSGLSTFKFFRKFNNKTSQGSAGILIQKKESKSSHENVELVDAKDFLVLQQIISKKIIYKIGLETPFLVQHEFTIAKHLETINKFLPNFMRCYDIIYNIPMDMKKKNPFVNPDLTSSDNEFNDVILLEHCNHIETLDNIIKRYLKKKNQLLADQINSCINQLSIAILIAQYEIGFVHNDLHFDNILLCTCPKNTKLLYKFNAVGDSKVSYALLPTFGIFPQIIDYGFSYTHNRNFLYTGIHHDNKGYINFEFDPYTDLKTILCRLLYSDYNFGSNQLLSKFSDLMDKNFLQMPIDHETGWDSNNKPSIGNQLIRYTRPFVKNKFIRKYISEILDMINSLVILPLQSKSYCDMDIHIATFCDAWDSIEEWISSTNEKKYILKNLISGIRNNLISDTNSKNLLENIKLSSNPSWAAISTKTIETLYLSIIQISECIEGFEYERSTISISRKINEYKKLSNYKNSIDIYKTFIEPFVSNDVTVEYNDYIIVMDACNKKTFSCFIQDNNFIDSLKLLNNEDKAQLLFKFSEQ